MRRARSACSAAFLILLLPGCDEEASDSETVVAPAVVEVTAVYDASSGRHLFRTSADTVPAGWTTFRFANASPVLHFVFLDHLPGDRTSNDLLSEIGPIFQEAADLHVREQATDAAPPGDPTIEVTVTDSVLIAEREVTPGEHLVAVHFQEREPGLIGRDVHVARLDPETDLDETVAWLDFNQVEGLVSTPQDPAPATFLGGVHEMPLGNTAYFRVGLEPGEYLWISEQPLAEATYTRFTVPEEPGGD